MKCSIVPVNDEGSTDYFLNKTNKPRQGSRGISFTTTRGKIWLTLVVNLAIIVTFIFVSSSRFSSLNGDVFALEQGDRSKNNYVKQGVSEVAKNISKRMKEPLKHDTIHTQGHTKLSSAEVSVALDTESMSTGAPSGFGGRSKEFAAVLAGSDSDHSAPCPH